MKKFQFLLTTFSLLFTVCAFGQRTIHGTVLDSAGHPLSGVSVQVLNSRNGTKTNDAGTFTLNNVPNNASIVFSNVGYEAQTVAATDNISITLRGSQGSMTEVVVTALGITKARRSLGYATQNINAEQLVDKGDNNLLNALQGKIAGADITGAGGSAGASTNILLRGVTSFSGNQSPLFVVDGIPISNDVDESTIGLYGFQSSSRVMDLNLNNIESVNVLEGPAAAALYGSRASHGAIMITTKKGSGRKGQIDIVFNSSYAQQKVYGFPALQNKYGQGLNGLFSAVSANSFGPAFGSTPSLANGLIVAPGNTQYVNGVNYTGGQTIPYQPYPDNILGYFSVGTTTENNLTINGGDAKNNFGLAIGNSHQSGILPNTTFDRTNIQLSATSSLTDKLTIRGTATYFSTVQNGITQGNNVTYASYGNVIRIPRSVNFDYYKNNYLTLGGYNNWYVPNVYSTAIQDSVSASDNPFYAAYKNPIHDVLTRLLGNITASYDIASWLNVSYRAGIDTYTDRRKRTIAIGSSQVVRSAFTGSPGTATGGVMDDIFYRSEENGDFMATLKKNDIFLKGLNASLLVGQGVNQRKYQDINQTGYGLAVPNFYNITNASNLSLTNEYHNIIRTWSIYSDLSLSYNNYLFLELTGRQDHSSTLPKSKNTYFYPSASVSFVLTDAFKLNSDVLSFAKIRAAYAKVGDAPPPYVLQTPFQTASDGNNVANYLFPFGNVAGFASSLTLGNAEIRPQFTSTIDLGANIGLFKNKINIDATVYDSKSTDQIVLVAIPGSAGYQAQYQNVGSLTNRGLEITVSGSPIKAKNFTWTVSGNFALNRNKVTYIAPGVDQFSLGGTAYSGNIPVVAVGEPFGIIKGSKFTTAPNGERLVDSVTGLYQNYLVNQTVVDPNRKWIAGLTNTFNYKHFTLSFLLDYKAGGQFQSFTVGVLRANGSLAVTEDRDLPHILPGVIDMGNGKYRPNNIQISGQSYWNNTFALGSTTGASTSNEFSVFDASTLRVREITLSYDLTNATAKTKIFRNIRFTVFGRNLYYYSPNSPIDPELSSFGAGTQSSQGGSGALVRGLELTSPPNTRNIGASIRVTF